MLVKVVMLAHILAAESALSPGPMQRVRLAKINAIQASHIRTPEL